jgi:hypothetical protein
VRRFQQRDLSRLFEVHSGTGQCLADVPLHRAHFRFADGSGSGVAVTMLPWTGLVEGELTSCYGKRVEVERFMASILQPFSAS